MLQKAMQFYVRQQVQVLLIISFFLCVISWLFASVNLFLINKLSDFYEQFVFNLSFFFYGRENEQLSKYGDTKTARGIMLIELKKLIEANPLFRDKLVFPTLKASRLRTLINQR